MSPFPSKKCYPLIKVLFYIPSMVTFLPLFFLYKGGAEIVRKSLSYPLKLIAKNAGVNGSVVTEKVCAQIVPVISQGLCNLCLTSLELVDIQVLANENFRYGYNAATGKYEDLMVAGIIDPTKVCFYRSNALCCYVKKDLGDARIIFCKNRL